MAMAADLTIAQVQHIRELGEIDAGERAHAGHLRQPRDPGGSAAPRAWVCPGEERTAGDMQGLRPQGMAARVAQDIPEGWYVNLGIGIPTMVADYVPLDREVILHSENGILGMGPAPAPDKVDPWLVNAGKQASRCAPAGPTATTPTASR
jgi:hypothetical protein